MLALLIVICHLLNIKARTNFAPKPKKCHKDATKCENFQSVTWMTKYIKKKKLKISMLPTKPKQIPC